MKNKLTIKRTTLRKLSLSGLAAARGAGTETSDNCPSDACTGVESECRCDLFGASIAACRVVFDPNIYIRYRVR